MDIEACLKSLQSRYDILAEIGQGGMGKVYRARDTQLERLVAIKIPLPPDKDKEKWDSVVTRFRREGRTLAKLSDPGIMSVYDLGEAAGIPYMVSEWIDGMPVHRRPGPWSAAEILSIAHTLCQALAHAHNAGVIHRDIKPSNILLRSDGSPVLIDFGIARFTDDSTLTKTGSVLGTLVYLAPELLMGRELGPPVDQYALGCVLYELAVGQTWIQAQTLAEIVQALLHQSPRPIVEARPGFDPKVAELIHKMIERTPEDRFPTLDDALLAWLALEPEDGAAPLRVTGSNPLRRLTPTLAELDPTTAPTEQTDSQELDEVLKAAGDTAAYAPDGPPSLVLKQSASQPRVLASPSRGPRPTPAPDNPAASLSPLREGVEPPNTAAIELTLGSRRKWGRIAALLIVLAVLLWRFGPTVWYLYAGGRSLDRARGSLAGGMEEVGQIPNELLDSERKAPAILLGEGHMAFAEGRPRDGVEAYSQALAISPEAAADPALIANLVEAAAQGSSTAADLLVAHPTEKIRDALLERSVGPGFKPRQNTIAVLRRLHSEDEIDWGKVGSLDLEEGPDCPSRRAGVHNIEQAGDKRAIPQLRRVRRSRGTDRLRNMCLLDDVDRALAKLAALN